MITFREITKAYKEGVKAVDGLSLELREGEIFGFLGPNGAGKSTTIKMLVGIIPPTSGEILFNGSDIRKDPMAFKRTLAYVPDEPRFYQKLTGYEYLNFIADIFSVSEEERKRSVNKYADLFGLKDALSDQVSFYSHGMGQKLSLMAALIHNPKVIVLDEPMVGLDPKAAREVKDIMRQLADDGAIVFFSTHVLEVAANVCDRVGIINKGHLITEGRVDELLHDSSLTLEDFFLDVTEEA